MAALPPMARAAAPRGFKDRLAVRAVQLGFLAAILLLWYLMTANGAINPLLLPPFTGVVRQFLRVVAAGDFIADLRTTVYELLMALAIALVCGGTVGYLTSRTRFRIRVFDPLLSGLYSVPGIVIYPLYVLFFGLGPPSKIAIGATIAFFPVALSTMTAFGTVDPVLVRAAKSMGASDWQLFRYVLLPAAFPLIVTGVRMGIIIAFLAIIGSETIASLSGLGHQIVTFAESMNMTVMFAYIVFVILIALLLNGFVSSLEARAQRR
jgi:ABC-type nitrate/sulfonate/bicarbonate transport system permease component